MKYSEAEIILKQQGFKDAMERRDLPLPEYTPEEVKVWRTGLKDGKLFWKQYSRVYHGIQQRNYNPATASASDNGFASILDDAYNSYAPSTTSAERVQWNKGRRYGKQFQEIYRRSYNRGLIKVSLGLLLMNYLVKRYEETGTLEK